MLRRSLASAALRPLTAVAHGRHSCARRLSAAAGDVSIALPKFLVTTVKTEQVGDKIVFDSKSPEAVVGELPVFLVDVKYEDNASVAGKWTQADDEGKGKNWTVDKHGEGKFSGTKVSQADFTSLLAKEGKEVVFFIHGFNVQTEGLVTSTEAMQTNFDSQKPNEVLVVPIDWACADPGGLLGKVEGDLGLPTAMTYHEDKDNSKIAGGALWKFFSGLKKEKWSKPLNVIAHSMGNRVLRCVGKSAAEDSSWHTDALKDGTSLLQAAPEDLKNNENLFDNIFFVSADIPESVFDEPNGLHVEQAEHGLQSGVAALAVMTKRMHVLHANGGDQALNASFVLNTEKWKGRARLGARGPWSSGLLGFGDKSAKVWDKIGDELEKYEGETDPKKNNSNVHVQDCSGWNTNMDFPAGHSYQYDPKSVAYYLKHMTKGK